MSKPTYDDIASLCEQVQLTLTRKEACKLQGILLAVTFQLDFDPADGEFASQMCKALQEVIRADV